MTSKCSIDYIFKLPLLLFVFSFVGCLTGGTHGSIKSYGFKTDKNSLQSAVEKVISENDFIKRDTIKNYMIDVTSGRNDTIINNYYNDTVNYVTIYIKTSDGKNEYTIQYGGDKEYWDTSKISEISIAYAFDKNGSGGSVEITVKVYQHFSSKVYHF
jgi:hypothetical protein